MFKILIRYTYVSDTNIANALCIKKQKHVFNIIYQQTKPKIGHPSKIA